MDKGDELFLELKEEQNVISRAYRNLVGIFSIFLSGVIYRDGVPKVVVSKKSRLFWLLVKRGTVKTYLREEVPFSKVVLEYFQPALNYVPSEVSIWSFMLMGGFYHGGSRPYIHPILI